MNSFSFVVLIVFVILVVVSFTKVHIQHSRFLSRIFALEGEQKKSVISPKQYSAAKSLIDSDVRISMLYKKLTSLPRDNTQKRKIDRSYVIREIFGATHNVAIASIICVLADAESTKAARKGL